MKNTIEWFQGNSGELRPAVATGRMLTLGVPGEADARQAASADSPPAVPPGASEADVAVVETTAETKHDLVLVSPSQTSIPLAATGELVTIGPLVETGLWTVRPAAPTGGKPAEENANAKSAGKADDDDPRAIQVACNLVDAAESDLRPRGELAEVEGRALLTLGGQSLWFYLTLLAAALVAAEWWLYQRRIVG
jgi:hypothetical protein